MDYIMTSKLIESIKILSETINTIESFSLVDYLVDQSVELFKIIIEFINVVVIDVGTMIAMVYLLLYIFGYEEGFKKSNFTFAVSFLIRILLMLVTGI